MSTRRWSAWALCLVVVAAVAACDGAGADAQASGGTDTPADVPKQPPKIRATRVEVATLAHTSEALELELPAEVEGSREALLASALGGFVERVSVEKGQIVRKGATLARIDARLHRAQQRLAGVEVTDAKREYERLVVLDDAVPKAQIDAASSRLERARAQYEIQNIMVDRTVIVAPFDGVITDVEIEPGEVAAPGAPVMRLVRLDPIHVTVAVSDRDVVGLTLGDTATVQVGASPEPLTGTVSRIGSTADLNTRAFAVEVELPNPEGRLRPGMIASVRLRATVMKGQILLPQDALVTRLEGNGVFVADADDVARWRPLELGGVLRDQVIVLAGLSANERVVFTGHRELAEGDALIVARTGSCCTAGRVVWGSTPETVSFETTGSSTAGAVGTDMAAPGGPPSAPADAPAAEPAPAEEPAPPTSEGAAPSGQKPLVGARAGKNRPGSGGRSGPK